MGISSSKRSDEKVLKNLILNSQKACLQCKKEKEDNIRQTKDELISLLNQKELNISKEKMKKILEGEDYITIYDILNRILEILKKKCINIVTNSTCPYELKAPLHSVIYAANRLEMKELKEFMEKIKQLYDSEFIYKVIDNKDNLVNEVIVQKLKINVFPEQIIKERLKQLCIEKNIDYEWLETNNLSKSNYNIRASAFSELSMGSSFRSNNPSNLFNPDFPPENKNISDLNNSNDKNFNNEDESLKNDPLKSIKLTVDTNENLFIMKDGENLFLPYDENIDKECYNINNIENWANSFYNLKSGILLEKYKELISKSEFSKFFEGLNYEYGINNYPLDIKKAFEVYKKAADSSTDMLSMYRLYHIYKKDFKKFNINERNHVLEKFYLMKCFAYLPSNEKLNLFFQIFDIGSELRVLLMDKNNIFYDWYLKYFEFLKKNYDVYNINIDDVIIIEAIIYYYFEGKVESVTKIMDNELIELANKGSPEAMYNLVMFYDDKDTYKVYYKKLYDINYYRCFEDYSKELPNNKETLNILKKSISHGYYSHIKYYLKIFMMINELDDIFKSPTLKSEFLFILNGFIDSIIFYNIEMLLDYIYIRKISIKHYNFGEEFKTKLDPIMKEIMNYFHKFMGGNEEENKNKLKSISKNYYSIFYTVYGYLYFYGMKGIVERNYDETINKYNFLLKNDEHCFDDRFFLNYIFLSKIRQRRLNNNSNENNKKDDNELVDLEKKIFNLYYDAITGENINKYPPSYFYYLSRYFRPNAIHNDMILEYVFLNRAANAEIINLKGIIYQIFEEKYIICKAKKKIKEKNKEENFKKIKNAKGAINVEGYGEDGTICPICLENKKSIIALPCKHFFCGFCMDKLLIKNICPICRIKIRITFDVDLKKENVIKSKLIKSYYSSILSDDSYLDNDI